VSTDHQPYDLTAAYDRFAEWFQILDEVYYDSDRTKRIVSLIATIFKDAKTDVMSQPISVLDCACGIGTAVIDIAKVDCCLNSSNLTYNSISYEAIPLKGWPVRSSDVKLLMDVGWRISG
jgi:hypothetical protein